MAGGPLGSVIRQLRRMVGKTPLTGLTDRQLLDRFSRERDEAAFTLLVERHGAMVLSVCRRVLRDPHHAEDAFQMTFLVLSRKAGSLSWHTSVAGWLHAVAARVSLKVRTRQARPLPAQEAAPVSAEPDPLAEMSVREMEQVLDEELQRLPEKYRAPLVLCYLQGRTRDEAAEQLGWTVGAVKGSLERGRELLRRRLLRRGIGVSSALLASYLLQPAALAAAPAALRTATVQAVLAWTSGGSLAGLVAPHIPALASAFLRAAFLARLQAVAAVLCCVGLTGVSLTWGLTRTRHGEPAPPAEAPALVKAAPPRPEPQHQAPPPMVVPPPPTPELPAPPAAAEAERAEGERDRERETPPPREGERGPEDRRQAGTLDSLDAEKGLLSITTGDEGRVRRTYPLAGDARIILDGQRAAALTSLARGGRVRLLLDERDSIIQLDARGPVVRGVLTGITEGEPRVLTLRAEEGDLRLQLSDRARPREGDLLPGGSVDVQVSADGTRALAVGQLRDRERDREKAPRRPREGDRRDGE